jgi:PAS domain S-box-containing protein
MHVGKVGQVAAERHPILVKDVAYEDSWIVRPEWAKREGIRSFAGYPLVFRDHLLGVIAVFSRRPLGDQEFTWLGLFANYAAVAIANTRAFEELKGVEEALRSSERNLILTINTIPIFISVSRADGTVLSVNQAALDYHGVTLQDVQRGDHRTRFFHPDDVERVRKVREEALKHPRPFQYELRAMGKDGRYRWFSVSHNPLLDDQGRIDRWYATAFDIEDRKRAEAEVEQALDQQKRAEVLLAEEKRLLEMVASGGSLLNVLDALCRSVESMAGRCYCSVYLIDPRGTKFHNGAAPSLPSSFNDPIEGAPVDPETGPCGMAASLKRQVIAEDVASDPRWPASMFSSLALAHGLRSCWSTPILSLAGDVLGTFAIYQDEPASPTPLQQDLIARFNHIASIAIERAHGEAALKRSEALLTEAQHLSLTGSFTWRVATDEITWSEQLYRIYEIGIGERVTLELIRTRVHPEDVSLLERMRMVHQTEGGAANFEWRYRLLMPNGSIKYLQAVAHATRDQDGHLEYIAAVQDVTESKVAEEALTRARSELAHMARVTTLSTLTASIAHDVNQPIAAIITSADAGSRWLTRDQPNVQRACEAISRIQEDGARAARIISHLKAFYRNDVSPEWAPVSANDVVREMLALLRHEADRHSVVMRTQLPADLPLVPADRVQLQQVLMNLMLNGMEAMAERGGELTIRTQAEEGEVLVSVSDVGVGVPSDMTEHIFNAFYTTKAEGTGMGLAISRTIIESHGGRLWATVNPERGTTFHFTLPTDREA